MRRQTEFLDIVREEVADLAGQHGMREASYVLDPVLETIVFSSDTRMLYFLLEVQDAYASFRYGPAPGLDVNGESSRSLYDQVSSWDRLLQREGKRLPYNRNDLYSEGRLREVVRAMVSDIRRHSGAIFGSDWNADGG